MTSKHIGKYKLIAHAIKEERTRKKITQNELANIIGISKSYLSKIEAPNCDKPFSLEILFDISEALNTPLSTFLKYLEEEEY